ncbi:MAG: polyphosphate polymerase domain-containing protein [Flavobacteriaceae bacterium]|nr:polyphosphate polymerase domain-containing protein [Flavobacteriaceae bacterium]
MNFNIKNIAKDFSSISLKEMDSVALMKRIDTKFVIRKDLLNEVLESIRNDYSVLEINNNRLMNYNSLYFDTDTKKFYYDHHNKRVRRTKIRIRKYVESDIYFLEIKQKDIKGNTIKNRIKINEFETDLSDNSKEFIKGVTEKDYQLNPSLWNSFKRITLVNKNAKERVTIDLNLSFSLDEDKKSYDDLVIIELKQERYNRNSPIVKTLKKHRIHPYSISKYCVGMINLYQNIKYNRFKEKLIKINQLSTSLWSS